MSLSLSLCLVSFFFFANIFLLATKEKGLFRIQPNEKDIAVYIKKLDAGLSSGGWILRQYGGKNQNSQCP